MSPSDGSDGPAFVRSFLAPPLLPCATPSTVEGEDRSFLGHRRTPLKLPPPTTPSAASAAAVAMHNSASAGPPAKPRVGSSQVSEASLKRKRGVFQKDLQHMMYGFGDDPNPLPETVSLVEDIVVEYITDMVNMVHLILLFPTIRLIDNNVLRRTFRSSQSLTSVHKAQNIASKRGRLLTEDFLYLVRKDPPKLHRCTELLSMHEELKLARKAFDVNEETLATAD
ncbi:transcription initiation factor IID, 18kD subunit family protein [Musa troglodytarum]|uniref:Transcription initiation factor TFIID subunit 13 n=1 Tax=Musa troglodytarum TaxID=320322 RepID=A0A9E7FXB6_9LILI|nr:transcription initiation factor IID, 18kD subunit family protein [Musa troglodytarum]